MTNKFSRYANGLRLTGAILLAVALSAHTASAADFEAFEFNDSNGTELFQASNSANPGNQWFATNDGIDILPSEVRAGSYEVYKDTLAFTSSYLQTDNFSSGKVYMIAEMSGWALRDFDSAEREEIRFAFIDEDTGDSGNTLTAQIEFERTAAGGFQLNGTGLGTGGSNIATVADLALDQTAPFTAVLEVDKDANTYKVFYRDGSNPTQFLGLGNISPSRGANSVRFVMNNNWGSDFDFANEEHFGINRFAISDTNPLTDLLTASIDRTTGALTLANDTGTALSGITSIRMTSASGALDSAGWNSVTGNYDSAGDGSVDANDSWMIDVTSPGELRESAIGGDGGSLAIGQQVVLSQGDGIWTQSPFEDIRVELTLDDGTTRSANINFSGNGGAKFAVGDLDFDGALESDDWLIFQSFAETDMTGLSIAQGYQRGDLDGDGVNSVFDFGIFKTSYNTVNGAGAFEDMVANIPEPSSGLMACMILAWGLTFRRRTVA